MGIANKTAGIISQKLIGGLLLSGAAAATLTKAQELEKVVVPYLILTAVLVFLAVLIMFSNGLPEVSEEQDDIDLTAISNRKTVFEFPNLFWAVLPLFAYVGLEVITGDTILVMVFH